MTAYYNEIDKYAAEQLRQLIKAGVIAPGDVDERSIEEVSIDDIKGYKQVHFFAGFGVWSYALRSAGWADDRDVWTASSPCPPFSAAGKQKPCPACGGKSPVPHVGRTGYFVCCHCEHQWLADGRHLYPELWRLVALGRPDTLFGEQVSSSDGRTWLALVRASLEILGYAVGAKDTCSAGVGGWDIRQRLYFMANAGRDESVGRSGFRHADGRDDRTAETSEGTEAHGLGPLDDAADGGTVNIVADTDRERLDGQPIHIRPRESREGDSEIARSGRHVELADSENALGWWSGNTRDRGRRSEEIRGSGFDGELCDTVEPRSQGFAEYERDGHQPGRLGTHTARPTSPTGELNSPPDAEWIYCRDGKYRPVAVVPESELLEMSDETARDLGLVCVQGPSGGQRTVVWPLIQKGKARMMRLRGYGNGLNADLAIAYVASCMDELDGTETEI